MGLLDEQHGNLLRSGIVDAVSSTELNMSEQGISPFGFKNKELEQKFMQFFFVTVASILSSCMGRPVLT